MQVCMFRKLGCQAHFASLPIQSASPIPCRPQVGGYTVLEVSVDLGTVTVMEGLTEDAVYARLHEGE